MKRKLRNSIIASVFALSLTTPLATEADINWGKVITGGIKTYQAYTISDNDLREYVHAYIVDLDKKSKIAPSSSTYAQRLAKLTNGIKSVDGVPLNFKVYITNEVNAFACADGSVRVYSGLMDVMNDNEVLGVIGHEIGHVAHKDTKNAMKRALLNSALFDAIGSTSSKLAALTDSQLGAIGEALLNSKYSRKQETNADEYGYSFLKKNGKNPWYMASAFNRLQKLDGSSKSNLVTKMFSTHPDTSERIKNITKKCQKDKIAKPADCSF